VLIVFPLLFIVSFLTLFERKILAGIQRRHGPVIIGFFGLLQPFADGLKLMLKEINVPQGSYTFIFFFASFFSLFMSLLY
jgi:NADH:ubiquinone oxidoreductase subunit H